MDVTELVQKSMDEWNERNKGAFLVNFTESSEITGPNGLVVRGLEGIERFWDVWQGAFPDNQCVIGNIFAAGDRACAEITVECTHTGTLHLAEGTQIPATGRRVYLPMAEVNIVCDDKFVTSHVYFDQFDLLTQLGLMPIHRVDSHRN